jgi:hypothetical protein
MLAQREALLRLPTSCRAPVRCFQWHTSHTHSYLPALQYRRGTRLHAACGSFSTFCGKKRDSNCRGTRCPCMTVLPSACPAKQWRCHDTRIFGPIVLLNPSTAEDIIPSLMQQDPEIPSGILSLTEGLCKVVIFEYDAPRLRRTNFAQRPAGSGKLLPFPQ